MRVSAPAIGAVRPRSARRRRRTRSLKWVGVALLTFWTLVALAPVVITLMSVFKANGEIVASPLSPPSSLNPDGLVRAWNGPEFGQPAWRYALNSVIAVSIGVGLAMAVSTPAAYALARRPRALSLLNRYFVLLLTVPGVVTWVALFKLASSLNMLSSPFDLGIIYGAIVTPIATVLMRAHFSGFPVDLIDAAKVDGSSELRAFVRVVMPLSFKTTAVVALLQAIFIWNELGLALILQLDGESQTLPVGIALFKGQYTSDAAAQYGLLAISLIPILVLYVVARKRITAGMQIGALK